MLKLFFLSHLSFGEALTNYVERLDRLNHFLIASSVVSCVLITVAFVYFGIRYRRKFDKEEGQAKIFHNTILEFSWSFIPFVIFTVAFIWGWVLYSDLKTVPKNSLEIHVYGQQWNWEFVYKNGRKTINELRVPLKKPVKLIMTSRDVIHSLAIPSFKIKQDVVPGMYTSLWFNANQEGQFHMFCTEFCGTGHSSMLAKLHVMSLKDWEEWLRDDPNRGLTLSQIGEKTFQGRCTACHSITKESMIGPGLKGLFNSKRVLNNGKTIRADENYIRESILNPGAKIVSGYQNQMTPFAGILSEEELATLIEYIKGLK